MNATYAEATNHLLGIGVGRKGGHQSEDTQEAGLLLDRGIAMTALKASVG